MENLSSEKEVRTNRSIEEGKSEIIIELLKKGYSYGKIHRETGYSKSAVCYHGGKGQKEKAINRANRQKKGFKRKVWSFIYGSRKLKKPFLYKLCLLRKKGRTFFNGENGIKKNPKYSKSNMIIKQPRIWEYFGKLFPGITSKEESVQAVNQWTGKPDYYDNGQPILFPYCRCKLTDEIINVKGNDIEVDHADGNRRNNTIENFTFVKRCANAAKGQCKSYEETSELMDKISTTIKKYKK